MEQLEDSTGDDLRLSAFSRSLSSHEAGIHGDGAHPRPSEFCSKDGGNDFEGNFRDPKRARERAGGRDYIDDPASAPMDHPRKQRSREQKGRSGVRVEHLIPVS